MYVPETFLPRSLEEAKHIALTNDPLDPDKFHAETAFLIDLIKKQSIVSKATRVLDFGCGMGRVSKKLIETFTCTVQGVDTSQSMRYFAHQYVSDKNFLVRPSVDGVFDVALAVFVLQHVESPEKEIRCIYDHLAPGGRLLVVNEKHRLVPFGVDAQKYVIWRDDGVDIESYLDKLFSRKTVFPYYKDREILCALWEK